MIQVDLIKPSIFRLLFLYAAATWSTSTAVFKSLVLLISRWYLYTVFWGTPALSKQYKSNLRIMNAPFLEFAPVFPACIMACAAYIQDMPPISAYAANYHNSIFYAKKEKRLLM